MECQTRAPARSLLGVSTALLIGCSGQQYWNVFNACQCTLTDGGYRVTSAGPPSGCYASKPSCLPVPSLADAGCASTPMCACSALQQDDQDNFRDPC
jgi:hypothetical protein